MIHDYNSYAIILLFRDVRVPFERSFLSPVQRVIGNGSVCEPLPAERPSVRGLSMNTVSNHSWASLDDGHLGFVYIVCDFLVF